MAKGDKGEKAAPDQTSTKAAAPEVRNHSDERPLDVEPDSRYTTSGINVRPRGVLVEELMTRDPATVPPSGSLTEAAQIMRDVNIGFLPVMEPDGSVVGVLTDRDIVVRAVGEDLPPGRTRVEEVMTEEVVSCHSGDDIAVCATLLRANQISRLVVLGDDDVLAGVISLADLAQYADERDVGRLVADVTEREAEPH
jgi:CBS domain-containing protein